MISHDVETWDGQTLLTADGDKIGQIQSIYLDGDTDQPAWMAVKTGKLGSGVSLVPLQHASPSDKGVSVPYDKQLIKQAPTVKPDEEISAEDARALYAHYSIGAIEPQGTVGHDTSGPTTDTAMTRSEEELRVGTSMHEAGHATLRKEVVTEHVQTTVPVRHEEARIEREPITSANADAALDGPPISTEEHEVTLYAEQPVVEKRTVPKERVRLTKDTYVEEAPISEEVRSEQIHAESGR